MIFRSEVSSGASRQVEATVWINEIESAKSIADLKTSYTITGAKLQTNFEVLHSEITHGLMMIINDDFREGSSFKQKLQRKKNAFAQMICESFRVGDTGESVLDFNEILKVEE